MIMKSKACLKSRLIFTAIFTMLILSASHKVWADNLKSFNCSVTFIVIEKQRDHILGYNAERPNTHSVVLKPITDFSEDEQCTSFINHNTFRMNNVEGSDPVFYKLVVDDIVLGTLNYQRPSHFGKFLHDNYHYGFRVLQVNDKNYEDTYKYFRHIAAE